MVELVAGGTMNENNGFIVLKRKLLNWEWYKDANTKILFLHCLLKANWKDGKFEGIDVPRGSFVTSLSKLSEELSSDKDIFTIRNVRTAIKHLETTKEITSKSFSKFRIITINNYDKYQEYDKVTAKQVTSKRQASDNVTDNNRTIYKQSNNITNNNIINNNIYDFVEQNFGRTLSPIEYEEVSMWSDTELTRYAIKQSVMVNKCSIKYISRILSAYERENIKTVQQAQERERQYIEAKKKNNQTRIQKKSGMEKFREVLNSIPDD